MSHVSLSKTLSETVSDTLAPCQKTLSECLPLAFSEFCNLLQINNLTLSKTNFCLSGKQEFADLLENQQVMAGFRSLSTPVNNPLSLPKRERGVVIDRYGMLPLPPSLSILTPHSLTPHFPHPTTTLKRMSSNSSVEIPIVADPELVRTEPINRHAFDRAYRKFWARRGMTEPSEPFTHWQGQNLPTEGKEGK